MIGYATVTKKDVTGSVAGINQNDIKSRPVTNALQAMQGKVAGVDITSNERPGQVGSTNIRGVRSLTASNSLLYIVDGIPLSTGGIEYLNPNDIESIDVLKDASATAIYGSRGANGVVIVSTKQGKVGKMQLSLNSSFTTESLVDRPPAMTASESETSRRVLVDYRQTISELVLDNFTKPWQHWAAGKKKMVRNQSHGSPANILDRYAVVDIPETEGEDILRFKFATSTANIMGKPLASSETATWLNEHFQSSLGDVKQAVDKYFVGGVNHVFWHGTNYSPQNDPWPGWLFYAAVHFTPANPFWKDFGTLNNYVARCQSFLQKGKPDNDVLLYFPFNDKNAEPGRDMLHHFDGMEGFGKTVFKESAEWLLNQGPRDSSPVRRT